MSSCRFATVRCATVRIVAGLLVSTMAGCCLGAGRHYSDDDARGFMPAFAEWRFVCKQGSRFDASSLPTKPSVACAEGYDCDNPGGILQRLERRGDLYAATGQLKFTDDPSVPGEDLMTGLIEKSQCAHGFEDLCRDAAAQGFDIVVISYHNSWEIGEGGDPRLVSSTCSGAIIATRSRQVIAPVLLQYGTPSRDVAGNVSAPATTAPTMDGMQAQFADLVATKLDAIVEAHAGHHPAATSPSASPQRAAATP